MYNREIEGHSLWAWAAAAISAPAAQFLGSTPWHWTLLLGLAAAGIWLCVEAGTVYGRRDWKPVAVLQILFLAFAVSAAAGWSGACWPTARQSWTIPVVLLVLGACAAEQGCRTGARCGAVLFWCLVLLFAVLVPLLCQRWSGEICGRKTGATGARRQRYCYYLPPRRCCPEKRDGAPGSGDWGWQSLALECPC